MVRPAPLALEISPRMPRPAVPVPDTAPVALMSSLPVPEFVALIPDPPETATALIVTSVVLALPTAWIPAVPVPVPEPVTAPVALTLIAPASVPLEATQIPNLPPDTAAAVTEIGPPESFARA